ncbi:MAG: MerR family transcriptional regulator [Thermoleophilia bacterium]|nr:MerR family transcriptional regulator [Thermoleophilia bacterium]
MAGEEPALRIGELSRRVGISVDLLRAWERRYGLLRPRRTPGGFRLYSEADERRVRRVREAIERGLSAAEAARHVLAAEAETSPAPVVDGAALRDALDRYDDAGAHAAFDRLLAALTLDTVLSDVVLPYLHELGERWQRGEATVAQEHFASNHLRGRLLGLARGWGRGSGPLALLACAPGEQHDLALLAFGLALRARGWRITFLGADTPIETLAGTADRLAPALVVVSAVAAERFDAAEGLAAVASRHRVAVAGAGASEALAARHSALALVETPVEAAERVTALRLA